MGPGERTTVERHHPAGDLTFDVRLAGPPDGPPVLLLHGFPQTSQSWDDVVPTLVEAGLRTIAPDQRGYSPGARPTDIASYAFGELVGDVVALLDELGLDDVHLVGHDWGAAVSWGVAAFHPDRVRTVTTFSLPHLAAYNRAIRDDPDARERASYIGLLRQEGKAEEVLLEADAARLRAMYGDAVPPARVAAYLGHLLEPGALSAALAWYRAMDRSLAELPSVSVPTTFVWSDGDTAIGRAAADACGEHVTGEFEYVVLPDVTHWIPDEAPDAAARAILTRVGRDAD